MPEKLRKISTALTNTWHARFNLGKWKWNKMEQYVAIRNATKPNKRRQWIFRTKANSAQMSPDKMHYKTCHNLHHIACCLRVTHKEDCNVTSQFTLQISTTKDWVIFRRQNFKLHKLSGYKVFKICERLPKQALVLKATILENSGTT